jgi:hypothetical protein
LEAVYVLNETQRSVRFLSTARVCLPEEVLASQEGLLSVGFVDWFICLFVCLFGWLVGWLVGYCASV